MQPKQILVVAFIFPMLILRIRISTIFKPSIVHLISSASTLNNTYKRVELLKEKRWLRNNKSSKKCYEKIRGRNTQRKLENIEEVGCTRCRNDKERLNSEVV